MRRGVFPAAIATPLERNSLRIPCSGKDPATRAPLEATMMRKTRWLAATVLALSTAGCVETMDSGYGYAQPSHGYGNGYYSSGYYAQPAYYSPPVVYSQTRYVPVPTPVPVPQHQADRNDHRWGGDHPWDGHHDEQRAVEAQPP